MSDPALLANNKPRNRIQLSARVLFLKPKKEFPKPWPQAWPSIIDEPKRECERDREREDADNKKKASNKSEKRPFPSQTFFFSVNRVRQHDKLFIGGRDL